MLIVLGKIIGIFLTLLVGYFACKRGWLPAASAQSFSKLLINVSQPCLIFYLLEHQPVNNTLLADGCLAMLLAVLLTTACCALGAAFNRVNRIKAKAGAGVYLAGFAFTNNGFLGMAVAMTVFSEQQLFITMMINIPIVIMLFVFGPLLVNMNSASSFSWKAIVKSVFNPPTVATFLGIAFLTLHWRLPLPLDYAFEQLGATVVPLSMIVVGIQLGNSKGKEMFSQKVYYVFSFLRLVGIPLAALGLLLLLGAPANIIAPIVLALAMPTAALIAVFAEDGGGNTKLAAEIVFVTHLFSVLTLPALTLLLIYLAG
ncbi:MAG: AEC family transporter [Gracilibacteraceae bacterium]|jgi:predicted permease|nr:AEC family transporter [Gracilibacteraceae bacterium]